MECWRRNVKVPFFIMGCREYLLAQNYTVHCTMHVICTYIHVIIYIYKIYDMN